MKNFLLLMQLLPSLLTSVTTLNNVTAIPGESKKQIIFHVIDVAAQIGEKVPSPLVQGISMLVDLIANTISPPVVPQPTQVDVPKPIVAG